MKGCTAALVRPILETGQLRSLCRNNTECVGFRSIVTRNVTQMYGPVLNRFGFKDVAVLVLINIDLARHKHTIAHRRGGIEAKLKIIGSHDAKPGEFPHMVSLQLELPGVPNFHICGGSIISNRWILSTSKCMHIREDFAMATKFFVVAGKHDLSTREDTEQAIEVKKYYTHAKYDVNNGGPYDIALILLQSPLTFNTRVRAINLPTRGSNPVGKGTICGWGDMKKEDDPQIQPILQTTTVSVIDRKRCSELMRKIRSDKGVNFEANIDDTNICTEVNEVNDGSSCEGDAGNPLIVEDKNKRKELVGLASWWLEPCGSTAAPTAYTKVSLFLDWISLIQSVVPEDD
ncbi:hypothetical protein QAD02_005580 [Eretmocerus hayati]|uniref:Uncharacterized protein n=1 Tax=Eretmocerus hayati TaxID=131215 RepID=A0ACC2NSX4_9HYME|nr:hypothetical protein QAD02_005580 [Eretmocerus hayati]